MDIDKRFEQVIRRSPCITSIISITELKNILRTLKDDLGLTNKNTIDMLDKGHKKTYDEVVSILHKKSPFYKMFLAELLDNRYFVLDRDFYKLLNQNLSCLSNIGNKDGRKKVLNTYKKKKLDKQQDKYFWEPFYEIDVIAYFNRIGKFVDVEVKGSEVGTSKDYDFKSIVRGYEVNVEIMTLSEEGRDKLFMDAYYPIENMFKEIFGMEVGIDYFPTNKFSGGKIELNDLRSFLNEKYQSILKSIKECEELPLNFPDDRSPRIRFWIYCDNNYPGIVISSIPRKNKLHNLGKISQKIEKKIKEKLPLFPDSTLNFLLINIASRNPLYYDFDELDREKEDIAQDIKNGLIATPKEWIDVRKLEEVLAEPRDPKISGIILYRLVIYKNSFFRKVDVYPNLSSKLFVPEIVREAIISCNNDKSSTIID